MHPRSTRARAILMLKSGISTRDVAKQLGISKSTIALWRANNRENIPEKRTGRPRKLSARDDIAIARLVSTGKVSTATAIQQTLKHDLGQDVHRTTVARSLRRSNLGAFVKRKKPLLALKHRKARLAFAKKYRNWTKEDWKRVFFSDETKINRWGSDGRDYCWRRRGEKLRDHHVVPTIKHGGGSIMVWGCFCTAGPGYTCKIEGTMDAEDYRAILASDLRDSLEYYSNKIPDPIFQHDNDPKHTAKKTKEWLEDSSIEVLDWPSQSPDLNPIEHLWCTTKNKLKEYPTAPTNTDQLWDRVVEVWNALTAEECTALIDSMPRRIAAVIAAKGGHTKY